MSDFYPHEPESLGLLDFNTLIPRCDRLDCCSQSRVLFAESKKLREQGKAIEADALRLLAVVCDFHPTFGEKARPYRAMMIMGGRRSPIPDDLSDSELLALRKIADNLLSPTLKARLFDVLWVRRKNHLDAKAAVENFLLSATELDTEQTWTDCRDAHFRALTLASLLGRSKPLFQQAVNDLVNRIKRHIGDDTFRPQHFMQVYVEFRGDSDLDIASLARTIAARAESEDDWRRARSYWEVAGLLHHKNKQEAESKECATKAAWTHVREAEFRLSGQHPSYMVAADFLARGIEALQQAGLKREELAPLKAKLTEYQAKIGNEMSAFEMKHDITSYVRAVEDHVKGQDFHMAMLRFAFGTALTKPEEVRQRVKKIADEHPMIHLFGASMMDDAGRVVQRRKGLLNVTGEEYEEEMEQEMFNQASQFDWNLRVQGFIEPARYQILREHFPSLQDMIFIVSDNPFVPLGHESIFLKGIHAGMHGDFVTAAHLLVPQLENSIRHVMYNHGADIRNLESDGTQPVKVLGPLLGMPEAKAIFGERLLFELRGALLEKSGFNFRNQVAHGFVSAAECHSAPGIMLWWLTIRLCLFPVFAMMMERNKDKGEETIMNDEIANTPSLDNSDEENPAD